MNRLIQKLNSYANLTDQELQILSSLQGAERELPSNTDLFEEGDGSDHLYVLQKGWGCTYKLLENGTRQVLDFPVPGDLLNARSLLLQKNDHSFTTISDTTVSVLSREEVRQLFSDWPRIGMLMLWALARDEAIMNEHLVNLGRRDALQSLAHFLTELLYRLRLVGVTSHEKHEFDCPITQADLADALGITPVHINRVLRKLREEQIATLHGGKVLVHDMEALMEMAGFDPGYLDQPPVKL